MYLNADRKRSEGTIQICLLLRETIAFDILIDKHIHHIPLSKLPIDEKAKRGKPEETRVASHSYVNKKHD